MEVLSIRKRIIINSAIKAFEKHLKDDEKSKSTVASICTALIIFLNFTQGKPIDKVILLDYKALLGAKCAMSSSNSMIAAVNTFLRFMVGLTVVLNSLRHKRKRFAPKRGTDAEYIRLVNADYMSKYADFVEGF